MVTSRGDWTHRLTHREGGTFFARLDVEDGRMYVSEVTHDDGFVECSDTDYHCEADSVEEHFSSPEGWWECAKLNKFKGNK